MHQPDEDLNVGGERAKEQDDDDRLRWAQRSPEELARGRLGEPRGAGRGRDVGKRREDRRDPQRLPQRTPAERLVEGGRHSDESGEVRQVHQQDRGPCPAAALPKNGQALDGPLQTTDGGREPAALGHPHLQSLKRRSRLGRPQHTQQGQRQDQRDDPRAPE